VVTKEVYDTLILSVDSPLDSWVLDSGASFIQPQSMKFSKTMGVFGKWSCYGIFVQIVARSD